MIKILFAAIMVVTMMSASAQTVNISGDVGKPYTLTTAFYQRLKQVSVKAVGHDGKEHEYTGVKLADILSEANAIPDNKLSGKMLAKYILVKAADNYQAVIALPEINEQFTDKVIILANKEDGKPLAANAAPYQVIIPGEKKYGRWVRQVTAISVLTAKE
ncbi:molybdopterin-dependent oxidoreductase [Mucilaginibacter sp. RS28]|uniref:Molybdopterin-dependent oxidoreductase n=1 Tax=Mucilaginibacter straminoryzae TaxID=2932774 RepID=A0A9X1X2H7_9SPHI|nr:molybdopterin-dependent oxidoreductase [Mucilaginibacter straminoryzae]MCJ8210057.1 molybdopterin-dependent oxidoreductase [Mucilaginibacter straminoryzae]